MTTPTPPEGGKLLPQALIVLQDSEIEPKAVAGSTVYVCQKYDYGLAHDDTCVTGIPHISVTLDPARRLPVLHHSPQPHEGSTMTTLAERLCFLRYVKGDSLREVEKQTGVSNAYLSQLETGKISDPGCGIILKLADYYGATLDFIIRGTQS